MKGDHPSDPKGLIRESYRIDGITLEECRSIFLDWALSVPAGLDSREAIGALLTLYGGDADHPMTEVLREGQSTQAATGRRGGRRARHGN